MACLLLAATVTVSLPRFRQRALHFVETSVGVAVYHIGQATNTLMQATFRVWEGYIGLIHVQEENRRLHATLDTLQLENHRLRVKEASVLRLQELLEYRTAAPVSFITAQVIGRDVVHWFDTVMLNKGEAEGVAVDMGVITPRGIVGVVMKVGRHHAQVLLVTDRRSAVAAVVERTRDAGIVQGTPQGEGGEGRLRIKYLPLSAGVAPGDRLVTSGLEGSFVEGIPIGQIRLIDQTMRQDETDLFLKAQITPAVDFARLEDVLILQLPSQTPPP